MTIKDIELEEISTEDLTQLEILIQKEKYNRERVRRRELCNKIIKDLEVFQKEFPFESISIMCPNCDEEIEIYPENIISQIKNTWIM